MADDVVLNKAATIERCLERVRDEYDGDGHELATDQRRQDALMLNLLWACETAIDRWYGPSPDLEDDRADAHVSAPRRRGASPRGARGCASGTRVRPRARRGGTPPTPA